jgi:hypothetical protein
VQPTRAAPRLERLQSLFAWRLARFFRGFAGYSSKAPFGPSMLVHFR